MFKLIMGKKEIFEKISEQITNCSKCDLNKTRNNAVPGSGSIDTDILFIGEAPGRNEDLKGKPFVGRAGKILDDLIESIGLKREDIFITNIIKCRPPNNRNPQKNEIKTCTPYLEKQIEIINPKIICPLGSFASSYILEKYNQKIEKISKIHGGKIVIKNIYGNLIIIPLYHPAVATYNPNTKVILLEDFKKIKECLKN